jgi:prophage antirepressor-like protein
MELNIFQYQGTEVRTVTVDGEPWFVAVDTANVLALANMRSSLALLDEDEKGVHSMDTPGGRQNLTIVSESGLYSLILRSRKAEAKQFKRWITREVLPSIRKTGSYSAPVSKELEEARIIQQALQISYRRQQEAEAKLAAAKPKADAWDHIVSSAGSWSYEEAAKVLFEQGVVTIGQKRVPAVPRAGPVRGESAHVHGHGDGGDPSVVGSAGADHWQGAGHAVSPLP